MVSALDQKKTTVPLFDSCLIFYRNRETLTQVETLPQTRENSCKIDLDLNSLSVNHYVDVGYKNGNYCKITTPYSY